MHAFAILGWLIMMGVGAYVALAGIVLAYVERGFTGRASAWLLVPTLAGLAVLAFFAFHAPFTLSVAFH